MAAAHAFLNASITAYEYGQLTPEAVSALKLHTTEMFGRVADACLQLFGGYGYMAEYPISRFWTDARVMRIYGGTSEIMKEIVARGLLGRRGSAGHRSPSRCHMDSGLDVLEVRHDGEGHDHRQRP